MDLCVADVTELREEAIRPGARAEFVGAVADLDDFATRSGTIGYLVLTGLGPRYGRKYRQEPPVFDAYGPLRGLLSRPGPQA